MWLGVISIFRDYGYRRLRTKARLKFLVADWGPEKFREVLETEYLGHAAARRPAARQPPKGPATTSACTCRRTAGSTSAPPRPSAGQRRRAHRARRPDRGRTAPTGCASPPHQKLVVLDVARTPVDVARRRPRRARPLGVRPSPFRRGHDGLHRHRVLQARDRRDQGHRGHRRSPSSSSGSPTSPTSSTPRSPSTSTAAPTPAPASRSPTSASRACSSPTDGEQVAGFQVHLGGGLARRPRRGRPRPHGARPQGHRRRAARLRRARRAPLRSTSARPARRSPVGPPRRRGGAAPMTSTHDPAPTTPRTAPAAAPTSCARSPTQGAARARRRDATADEVAAWAGAHLRPARLAVACSMAGRRAAAPVVANQLPGVDVLFLDTGYHFAETLGTRDAVGRDARRARSSTCCPSRPSPSRTPSTARGCYDARPGGLLLRCARSSRSSAALAGYEAWVTGVRRDEAPDPRDTPSSPGTSSSAWSSSTRSPRGPDEVVDLRRRRTACCVNPLLSRRLPVDRLRAVHPAGRPRRGPPRRPLGRARQDRMRAAHMTHAPTPDRGAPRDDDVTTDAPAAPPTCRLSQLDALESEAIHIFREVAGEFERPVLLFSGGKDSVVMLHLAAKAFWPGAGAVPAAARRHRPQLPRGPRLPRRARSSGSACASRSRRVQDCIDDGRLRERPDGTRNPLQTLPLLDAIAEHRFDAVFGGGRRDEEKARAKERIFSLRDEFGQWDPRNQRPELWNLYNGRHRPASTCGSSRSRTGPSSTSGATSSARASSCPALYYAHEREVFQRDGMWLAVGPCLAAARPARAWPTRRVRYRTVGDMSLHRRRRVATPRPSPTSSPRSPRPRSPSAAPPAPTTGSPRPPWKTASRRGTSDEHDRRPARPARASPPPGPSTTASPPSSAGCCTTPSRCSPTSSTPSSGSAATAGLATADLALLTDGLRAEREQGITIDVAYRYFATAAALVHPRRLPRARAVHPQHGHRRVHRRARRAARRRPQGRARADPPAPRRAALLRVPHVVLAVNKIDLVDYDEDVFAHDRRRRRAPSPAELGFADVARRSRSRRWSATTSSTARAHTPWYDGPTLLELSRPCRVDTDPVHEPFRMPVQYVIRPQGAARSTSTRDYRGYAGQLASGVVRVGDEVVVLPVRRAHHRGRRSTSASGSLRGRGRAAVGVDPARRRHRRLPRRPHRRRDAPPVPLRQEVTALACWLGDDAAAPRARGCWSSTAPARCSPSCARSTAGSTSTPCAWRRPTGLALNDIGRVTVRFASPLPVESYSTSRRGGAFLLVDPDDGRTLAAAMADAVAPGEHPQ